MKLVEEIFKRYVINEKKLKEYGFQICNNGYTYSKLVFDGAFELIVNVQNNKTSGHLLDKDFNEEFTQIDVEYLSNGFINNLKEECKKILIEIRDNCYEKQYFVYQQSVRIQKYIYEKYDVTPEFLFDDDKTGVFRNNRNKKWFGIIMYINHNRFDEEKDGMVEVINVNLSNEASTYREKYNVYPAYHMNKKYWVSIILNDEIQDDIIFEMIDKSYILSDKKK